MLIKPQNKSTSITFSSDGIRGVSGEWPFTPKGIEYIGSGLAIFLSSLSVNNSYVIIGRDTRLSGKEYSEILARCLIQRGISVVDLGIAPTPVVAYATKEHSASLGIIVSASHNPVKYNGVKLVDSQGLRLQPQVEKKIEELIAEIYVQGENNDDRKKKEDGSNYPTFSSQAYLQTNKETDYVTEYIKDHIEILGSRSLNGLRLVIDCSNGAVSRTGKKLLSGLGASVISLNDDISGGSPINHECGSEFFRMYPEKLIEIVKRTKADYGFAFDGDGDRVVIVDSKANFYNGDDLLYAFALMYKNDDKLRGNQIVTNKNANPGLESSLAILGIETITTANGDKNLEAEIWNKHLLLGGEQVGNIIINDGKHGAADSLYITSLLFSFLNTQGETLENITSSLKKDAQVSVSIHLREQIPQSEIEHISNEIRNIAEPDIHPRIFSWYSSTEPGVLNILMDATDSNNVNALFDLAIQFCQKIVHYAQGKPTILDLSSRKRL